MFYLIEQTNACNLRCVCCPHRFFERPQGAMTPTVFANILNQIEDKSMRIALHGYGEPILSPYFFENLVLLDSGRFTNVDFSSNGVFFTPDIAEKVLSHRCLSWVRISLNSSRPEVMERINTGSNYQQVVDNIREFLRLAQDRKSQLQIIIQLMRTKINENETPEEYYQLFGVRNFNVLIKRLDTLGNQIDYHEVADLAFLGGAQPNCQFANTSVYMHWDGDLVGCCLDNTKTQIYGNSLQGIYSETVQARKHELQVQFAQGDFTNLPLCKKCLGLV